MFLVFLMLSSVASADRIPLIVENGGEVSIPGMDLFAPEIIMEPGAEPIREWEWSSSNEEVVSVWPDNSIIALRQGSVMLSGRTTDGSGLTAKIKVNVPKIYTSADSITVSSPDGVEFGYFINASGISSISTTGDCFYTERLNDYNGATMCRIIPVKVGTGSFVFKHDGRRIKTVKVTVTKSAFETKPEAEPIETTMNGGVIAIVKSGVNIRKQPDASSTRMGSAQQGDKLIVTQAFYTPKWHQIDFNGETCYVSANYCELEVIEQSIIADSAQELDESVEARIDFYIAEFGLSEECKTVIIEYLPNVNSFDRIERTALYAYSIIMNDGTVYYLTVLQSSEPAWMDSSEKDWRIRTRYYDRFEK